MNRTTKILLILGIIVIAAVVSLLAFVRINREDHPSKNPPYASVCKGQPVGLSHAPPFSQIPIHTSAAHLEWRIRSTGHYTACTPLTSLPRLFKAPPPPLSPSDLQLALFAHMAFFPFDFNAGETPRGRGFSSIHYVPFYERVMSTDFRGQNAYGFRFRTETTGWYLSHIHIDNPTGFKAVVYATECARSIVLAFRGTYGNIDEALLNQAGPWWCNFRSIAGYDHSHVGALLRFLNMPATTQMLRDANIYITGHSLGGYLAYIATHELARLGLEGNIQRVAAFSAPIFTAHTIEMIAALSPETRSRMIHYYVPNDFIAGFVGIDMGLTVPTTGVFAHTSQLLRTLMDVRGVDISPSIYSFSNVMIMVERLRPLGLPDHIVELIWRLNGAMGAEALALTNQFRRLIRHEAVPQTWHTQRPDPTWDEDASMLTILRNFSQEWVMDVATDMMQQIFDVDAHFMMNFYPWLAE